MYSIRCPVCYASIQIDHIPDNCPACKERIKEKIEVQNRNVNGITTARTTGPGFKPLDGTIEDVY